MTKIATLNGCVWMGLLATAFAGPVQAESLLEVYQHALQSDPQIREAEARRLATQESLPQARGLLFPQINASGSTGQSDSTGNNVFVQEIGGQTQILTSNSRSDSDTKQWQLELRQTIFRWDQMMGLKQAGKQATKADADRESAHQDLIIRVAQRYFDILAAEDGLASEQASKLAIARQLDQAKQRFEVGLIAITDVQEAQAAYDQAVATEIAAKRSLATSREFLREITGDYVTTLAAPKSDLPLQAPEPADEASWVDTAMNQNLALVASRLDAEIARDEIRSRRSGYYPSVDLVANRSRFDTDAERSENSGTFQPADSDGITNSVSVQVSVPLFAGGRNSSRVREAVYLHRAAKEQLQRVARATERQARDSYLGVLSEISRVKALRQAVSSSTTALEATQAGFEVGTRTIVDVLDSQRQLYAAQTNYYRSRYDYLLNVLQLKQASGILRVQDMEQIDAWLAERGETASNPESEE